MPLGYGFLGFNDEGTAQRVLNNYNGARIPNSREGKCFRLNTAGKPSLRNRIQQQQYRAASPFSGGQGGDGGHHREFTLFVGSLSPEVDDQTLLNAFRHRYQSTLSAKGLYFIPSRLLDN